MYFFLGSCPSFHLLSVCLALVSDLYFLRVSMPRGRAAGRVFLPALLHFHVSSMSRRFPPWQMRMWLFLSPRQVPVSLSLFFVVVALILFFLSSFLVRVPCYTARPCCPVFSPCVCVLFNLNVFSYRVIFLSCFWVKWTWNSALPSKCFCLFWTIVYQIWMLTEFLYQDIFEIELILQLACPLYRRKILASIFLDFIYWTVFCTPIKYIARGKSKAA